MTDTAGFRAGRLFFGVLCALIAYAVLLAAAFVAARVTPSGDGFGDLAAVAMVLVLGGGAVLVALLVVGVVLFARGRKDLGGGLLIGCALGAVAAVVVLFPHVVTG